MPADDDERHDRSPITRREAPALPRASVCRRGRTGRGGGHGLQWPSSSGGTHHQTEAQALLAFSACIRAHGVANFPDPQSGGGFARSALDTVDENSPQFQSADKSCRSLGVASGFDHGPGYTQKHVQQEIAQSECMRKHGVPNMPLPDAQGQIVFPPGLSPRSPAFQAAQRHCAYLNP